MPRRRSPGQAPAARQAADLDRQGQPAPGLTAEAVPQIEPSPTDEEGSPLLIVSVAGILWVSLLIVTVALRVVALPDDRPLLSERSLAWAVWRESEGLDDGRFHGTIAEGFAALAYATGTPDEGDLRWIAAAGGILAVALFYPLRRLYGTAAALLGGALFSLNALAVLHSRTLSPEAFAPAIALLLAIAWLRDDLPLTLRQWLLALSGFLLPLAGGVALPAAGALLLAGALSRQTLPRTRNEVVESPLTPFLIGLVPGLLLGFFRLGLADPGLNIPSLDAFAAGSTESGAFAFGVAAGYQNALLLLAIVAAGLWIWKMIRARRVQAPGTLAVDLPHAFLTLWLALSLLWLCLAPDSTMPLLSLAAPASLLAAEFILQAIAWARGAQLWPAAAAYALALGVGTALLFRLSKWADRGAAGPSSEVAWFAFGIFVVIVLLVAPVWRYRRPALLALNLPLLVLVGAFVVRDGLETAHDLGDEYIDGRVIAGGADELARDARRAALTGGQTITVTPRALETVFSPANVPAGIIVANTPLPSTGVMVTGPGDVAPEGLNASGVTYVLINRERPPFDDFLDYYRWAFSRAPETETLAEGQLWTR